MVDSISRADVTEGAMGPGPNAETEQQEAIRIFRQHLGMTSLVAGQVSTELAESVAAMATALIATLRAGGKVLFCGNGGSAAQAQHLAAELTGRYLRERRPLPAISLTTDTSAITAIGNDYRFDEIFRRPLDALAVPGDALVALSTSGNSPDVILAAQAARKKGVTVLAFTGQNGGELVKHADLALQVPSVETPIVQEMHLAVGHVLCDLIELALVNAPDTFGQGREV